MNDIHAKPGDMLEYRCPKFGIVWQWRVHSVHLGAVGVESLIEISPVHLSPGHSHNGRLVTTWVPEPMTRTMQVVRSAKEASYE